MALTVAIDKPTTDEEFETTATIPVEVTVTGGTAVKVRAELIESRE